MSLEPIQLESKRQRFLRRAGVFGTMIGAKNMAPALGYKAQQWGIGANNSGAQGKAKRMRNNNRRAS